MTEPFIPHKANSRPAADIDESPFQHRTTYPATALWELGRSVRDVGVREDCLARPHPHDAARLELVYGHRRRRASILAVLIAEGLTREEYDRLRSAEPEALQAMLDAAATRAMVPVTVREMSDEEVLEEQGRENFQRAQPNVMEVALYLDTLMRPRPEGLGFTLDRVLAKTRKERSWVVRHLKLLGLSPKVREELLAHDELTEEYAIEIARLTSHRLQEAALDMILFRDEEDDGDPENLRVLSLADARRLIRRRFLLRLADAPFQTAEAALVADRGACGPCRERTGNQQGLFGDVNDDAVCTNVECYQAKARAQFEADAKAREIEVLDEDRVAEVFPHGHIAYNCGLVELDASAPYDVLGKHATWREVLAETPPPVTWAWLPGRGKVELVKAEDVLKIAEPMIKARRSEQARQRATNPAAQEVRRQQAEAQQQKQLQNTINVAAMGEVLRKWPENPSVQVLADLARTALKSCWSDTLKDVVRVLGLEDKLTKSTVGNYKTGYDEALLGYLDRLTKKREVLAFIACLMYCRGLTATHDAAAAGRVKRIATLVGVNYGAVERGVRSEARKAKGAKGKAKPAAEAKPTKAKATKAKAKPAAKPTKPATRPAPKPRAAKPGQTHQAPVPAAA
jgi:ParB-like chromosome segregation protein Spo0J